METDFQSRSVMDSSKWKLNPLNIQNDLQGSRDSRYRSICIKNVRSIVNVHSTETGSIQHRGRCLPKIMQKPERLRSSPILSYKKNSEKSSHRNGHNNSNNPSLPKPNLVFNSSTNEPTISSSNPQNRRPFVQPKDLKTPSCNKQNTTVSG